MNHETLPLTENSDDATRRAVMDFMHHAGKYHETLSQEDWIRVYLKADGFGPVTLNYASRVLEWDWSHVRDSSPRAFNAMWLEILKIAGIPDKLPEPILRRLSAKSN